MEPKTNLYLVMSFQTAEGATSSVTVKAIKEGLTSEEVKAVMDEIVATDLFDSKTGSLVKPLKAEIVDKTSTSYDLKA